MVQSMTIGALVLAVLGGAAGVRTAGSAAEEGRYGVCETYEARTAAKQAQKAVEAAGRALQTARNGGSYYAAAKLGMDQDPAAVGVAQARLTSALAQREAAFAACAR